MGIPYDWLANAPAGAIIIGPTVVSSATSDVTLVGETNSDNDPAGLKVGSGSNIVAIPEADRKRALITFDLTAAGIPSNATIIHVQLNLKYYGTQQNGSAAWVDRTVQAHEVRVAWSESFASADFRTLSEPWNAPFGAIDGSDVKASPESAALFTQQTPLPSWQYWDLTELTKSWIVGSTPNNGLMLWATNETSQGYDLLFRSSDDGQQEPPELEITWVEQKQSVYYLKDHLGSVRATVNEAGEVVGSDDYDPWGLAIRSSVLQPNLPNKFTGKERDTDFGLDWDYFGARYYDAEVGRWMVVDPRASDSPSLGPYVYVRGIT